MIGFLPSAFIGTIRYEIRIAMRKRASWLSILPLFLLSLLVTLTSRTLIGYSDPVARMGATATVVNLIGSLGVAIALTDLMVSQRRPGLRELLSATPAGKAGRAAGMVLGPWLIAVAPMAAVLLITGGWLALINTSVAPLVAALTGFVTILAPGSLLLTMLANLFSLGIPATAARILIVPIWYWATFLSPLVPVPSITGTVLSPLGSYQASAWMGVDGPHADGGLLHPPPGQAAAWLALWITVTLTLLLFLACRMILGARR